MRSIWIYCKFMQILAKSGRKVAGNAKKPGGSAECAGLVAKARIGRICWIWQEVDPLFHHALLHPEGWAADLNAPRIPPSQVDVSVFAGRAIPAVLCTEE